MEVAFDNASLQPQMSLEVKLSHLA